VTHPLPQVVLTNPRLSAAKLFSASGTNSPHPREIPQVHLSRKELTMKKLTLLCLTLLITAGMVIFRANARNDSPDKPNEKPALEKWEYLAVAGPSTTNFSPSGDPSMRKEAGNFAREGFVLEQHLDKLGSRGWELISVAGPPTDPVYYFKRRK